MVVLRALRVLGTALAGCGCVTAAGLLAKQQEEGNGGRGQVFRSAAMGSPRLMAARVDEQGFADAETKDSATLVVDPKSKLVHPRVVNAPEPHTLVAAGTRMVTFLKYYVYSAAVYLPHEQAHRIAAQARTAADNEEERTSVVAQMQDLNLPKVIRVAPYRNASLSHLRDGFGRALDARARKAIQEAPERQAQLQGEISTFKQLFPRGNLNLGEELMFVFKGDNVTLMHEGKKLGTMQSSFVGPALLDAYLGADSVIPTLRDDFWTRAQMEAPH